MADCECVNWCRNGLAADGRMFASHAPECSKYDPVGDCLTHVHALLIAMDTWARDEDGIHGDAFDAYEAARAFVGQPLPPNPDGRDDVTYKATKPMEVHPCN